MFHNVYFLLRIGEGFAYPLCVYRIEIKMTFGSRLFDLTALTIICISGYRNIGILAWDGCMDKYDWRCGDMCL